MSTFSRRGFVEVNTQQATTPPNGQSVNQSHHFQYQQQHQASPQPHLPNQSMAAGVSSPFNSASISQSMAGYGAPPVNGSMQVMSNNYHDRTKYQTSPAHYHNSNIRDAGFTYDGTRNDARSTAARHEDDDQRRDRRRSRSNNRASSSGRHRFTSGTTTQHPSTAAHHSSDYRSSGTTTAPNGDATMTDYSSYPATAPNNVTPPSPTPDVSAQASSQLDATQRRPAYLLHRDLVIGKGSYGQVCIASRGEAEGHSGSRGKRKKFACKCVLLRSDPKYIAKLQEEVNVLRELRGHENVIRLYDVFCVDNELFIITELGRGGDLFHLLTTHPKHGVTEAYAGKSCINVAAVADCYNSHVHCFGRDIATHRPYHLERVTSIADPT